MNVKCFSDKRFLFDPYAVLFQAFENLYPNRSYDVQWGDESILQDKFGMTDSNGERNIVTISVNIPTSGALDVLAHELAHVAVGVDEGHGKEWEHAYEKINDEYNALTEAYQNYLDELEKGKE